MAFLLALLIVVITLSTMYFFVVHVWWFPAYISEYGAAYDHQFTLTLIITGIIFFLAQIGLAYAIFRFRDRVWVWTPPIPPRKTMW
jgi:hypothetical protein